MFLRQFTNSVPFQVLVSFLALAAFSDAAAIGTPTMGVAPGMLQGGVNPAVVTGGVPVVATGIGNPIATGVQLGAAIGGGLGRLSQVGLNVVNSAGQAFMGAVSAPLSGLNQVPGVGAINQAGNVGTSLLG